MVSFDVYDKEKNVKETIDLNESVFSSAISEAFLHQVMVSYRANKRQGTVATKNRNLVHGTNRKPFRQKGTGRARQGTMHAPHHRGGATQFGPQPRSYRKTITRQMRKNAFRQSISLKAGREMLFVLTDLDFAEIQTKQAAQVLQAFAVKGRTLFIDTDPQANTVLSIRNIPKTEIKSVNECSPLDIFESDTVFITKAAAELYQQRYA